MTGVSPKTHGIATNRPFDPEAKSTGIWYWYASEIRARTLWQAAAEAGLVTGSVSLELDGKPMNLNAAPSGPIPVDAGPHMARTPGTPDRTLSFSVTDGQLTIVPLAPQEPIAGHRDTKPEHPQHHAAIPKLRVTRRSGPVLP